MDQAQKNEIAVIVEAAVNAVLDRRRTVDEKTHASHHDFVGLLMERHERREALIARIRESLLEKGALVAAGAFLAAIGAAILGWIRTSTPPAGP